ncbi:hypothetical protein VUR80DRAFT_5530 [Thermomyces stellatus]
MASFTAVNGVGSSVMRSSMTDTTSLTLTGVSTRALLSWGSSWRPVSSDWSTSRSNFDASDVRRVPADSRLFPRPPSGSFPCARASVVVDGSLVSGLPPCPAVPFDIPSSVAFNLTPSPSNAVLSDFPADGDCLALNGDEEKDLLEVGVGDRSGASAGNGPTSDFLGVHGLFCTGGSGGSGSFTVNDRLNGHLVFSKSSILSRISRRNTARCASSGSATGSSMRQYCGFRICSTNLLESSSMHQH